MIRCLGEALIDLICERPAASLAEADSFRPHFGGALANVAIACTGGACPTANSIIPGASANEFVIGLSGVIPPAA